MATALKLACVVVLCMLVVEPMATSALTCGDVAKAMGSCVQYLQKGGAAPPRGCCDGVRSLNAQASNTRDRQTACRCLQSAAKGMKVNLNVAAGLPSKCGVNIPYKISPSTNCNNVK